MQLWLQPPAGASATTRDPRLPRKFSSTSDAEQHKYNVQAAISICNMHMESQLGRVDVWAHARACTCGLPCSGHPASMDTSICVRQVPEGIAAYLQVPARHCLVITGCYTLFKLFRVATTLRWQLIDTVTIQTASLLLMRLYPYRLCCRWLMQTCLCTVLHALWGCSDID